MNPWVIITLITAGIVFVIDYLLRRKKWKDNSKEEKISLLVNMFSIGPHIFVSALGLLWGIVAGSPETAFGEVMLDVTLTLGACYFVVAIIASFGSLILRKTGKIKASTWINVIAFAYIVVVLGLNSLAGKLL